MDKFKHEMAEHKQDFKNVYNQLKDDAKKSIDLRKSAELAMITDQNKKQQLVPFKQ